MNTKNTLPTKFRTWVGFYDSFVDNLVPNATIVQYKERYPDGSEDVYEFSLREIKANCFDEMYAERNNRSYDYGEEYFRQQ